MKKFMLRTLWLGPLLFCFGCKTPELTREGKEIYYGISVSAEGQSVTGQLEQSVESLAPDAKFRLRKGTRVAFFPPDSCINQSAAPVGANEKGAIQMDCGILMSSLETRVAKAGYEVVSWQILKPGGSEFGGTLERARELGVQVLFEVDQLSVNSRRKGMSEKTALSVFGQTDKQNRAPFPVEAQVGRGCVAYAQKLLQEIDADLREPSATLATKAVDVQTGRALWYYQKTVTDGEEATKGFTKDFYWKAEPLYGVEPATDVGVLSYIGGSVMGLGGALAIGGIGGEVGPMTGLGFGVVVLGGLLLGIDYALTPDTIEVPYTYAKPEELLCKEGFESYPPFLAKDSKPGKAAKSVTFTFQGQEQGSRDDETALTRKLQGMISDDFVNELDQLIR